MLRRQGKANVPNLKVAEIIARAVSVRPWPRLALSAVVAVFLLGTSVRAQSPDGQIAIDQSLQFNPGYVSAIARQANQATTQAATTVRHALKGESAQIPASWRLVNVIAKGNDYVMFFQDSDGSVRSLRMQPDGAISGQDVVWLEATR